MRDGGGACERSNERSDSRGAGSGAGSATGVTGRARYSAASSGWSELGGTLAGLQHVNGVEK